MSDDIKFTEADPREIPATANESLNQKERNPQKTGITERYRMKDECSY